MANSDDKDPFDEIVRGRKTAKKEYHGLIVAAGDNKPAKVKIDRDYEVIDRSWHHAIGRKFDGSDATVKAITRELRDAIDDIDESLDSLEELNDKIKLFTAVARLAASLAVLAA